MLEFSFILAILIEWAFPFILAFFIVRRYKTAWGLFGVGALAFIASQIIHIPLNMGISALFRNGFIPRPQPEMAIAVNAVIAGTSAAICETPARLIALRLLKKNGRDWGSALMVGVGHGGIESILFVGLPVLINFVIFLLARSQSAAAFGLQDAQVQQYWSVPWSLPLAGAVERVTTIVLHILLTILVWLSIRTRNFLWFGTALLWHALTDSLVVLLSSMEVSLWTIEAVLAGLMVFNLVGIFSLQRRYGSSEGGL
jgi:uncharacterized membrane protein YhfC